MHVRDVPTLIFNELSCEQKLTSPREFIKQNSGPYSSIDLSMYSATSQHLGMTQHNLWLRLEEYENATEFTLHASEEAAVINDRTDALARIGGGRQKTGTSSAQRGQQYEETVWMRALIKALDQENVVVRPIIIATLGEIAIRVHTLLEQGAIETSQFFEADTNFNFKQ